METRRKILSFLLVMAFLSVWGNGWGVEGMKQPVGKPYAEGELLVKFREGVSEARIQEVLRQTETEVTKFLRIVKVYVLKLPQGAAVEDMVKKFQALPEVEYAEPNRVVTIQEKPEKLQEK
jgi:thermitase